MKKKPEYEQMAGVASRNNKWIANMHDGVLVCFSS